MKKFSIFIFLICLIIAIKLDAKQWTVSNNPNMPAQFGSVQTAIDSAAAGDTIFVYSSPNYYGSVNVTKKLHIIGAGYWGEWVSGRERTYFFSITILADSVLIEGVKSGIIVGSINPAVLAKGIVLRNLYGTIDLNRVDGCVIYNIISPHIQIVNQNYFVENVIVSNNIIDRLYNERGSNMFVLNNIFYIDTHNWSLGHIGSLRSSNGSGSTKYTIFQNNIFSKGNPNIAEYSSFNNNLTFNSRQNTLPYGNNNGANNIINQDPKFRAGNNSWSSLDELVRSSIDLRLADDSPARNAGADSTDIGISGGLYPWPRNANGTYDYSGRPRLPEIESFNLINPIVGTDGRLKFNVKGNKAR